ncbi:unnamed protein product, partial [Strongylus vulgaris]
NTIPATERRAFLPSRDDPIRPDTPPISPINAARTELGTFDTHLGRFANGVPNRVVLHTDQMASLENMERLKVPPKEPLPKNYLKTTVEQHFATYPDHRQGLFPAVNQPHPWSHKALVFRSPTHDTSASGSLSQTDSTSTNRLTTPSQDKTFSIENFPSAPYSIAPRPKQAKGNDLLETDRLGSWSMGRFDKEEPRYTTPEPRRDTTAVISVLQERTTRATIDTSLPLSNGKLASLPMFQPYQSPESITGSHALREVYNIRHHGRPRFVKIDLSNE